MAKNTYRLINPYIEGSLDTTARSRNSFNAGKKIYNTISNFFTNYVDDFYMTIQNVDNGNLSHFKINETKENDNVIGYNLVRLDKNFDEDIEKKLINKVDKDQKGGKHKHKHKDDSSSSSSSDSDYYKIPSLPINRFVYYYLPYYQLNVSGLTRLDTYRLFLPMFSLPINPSLEIRFDLYKYFV